MPESELCHWEKGSAASNDHYPLTFKSCPAEVATNQATPCVLTGPKFHLSYI